MLRVEESATSHSGQRRSSLSSTCLSPGGTFRRSAAWRRCRGTAEMRMEEPQTISVASSAFAAPPKAVMLKVARPVQVPAEKAVKKASARPSPDWRDSRLYSTTPPSVPSRSCQHTTSPLKGTFRWCTNEAFSGTMSGTFQCAAVSVRLMRTPKLASRRALWTPPPRLASDGEACGVDHGDGSDGSDPAPVGGGSAATAARLGAERERATRPFQILARLAALDSSDAASATSSDDSGSVSRNRCERVGGMPPSAGSSRAAAAAGGSSIVR
mmetsp:Transcript_20037/g.64012  ORF Transcript_20037/g.64012 Transcript_20037/m.64012 type:complete len:270 (-) Transcript_20037:81-890(-)